MSTKKKTVKAAKKPMNVIWFEIPADDVSRAKSFYNKLFGWKVKQIPGMDYYHIDTGGPDDSPDGGMIKRQNPQHSPVNYIGVPSVDKYMAKVTRLGGKICMGKTPVPGMGYFAICLDTENNPFAVWEMATQSK